MSKPMKVIIPYVDLHPLTKAVLMGDGIVPVSYHLGDGLSYSELLRIMWEQGETFYIVEQDVLPWPKALHELSDCQCHWGTYSYRTNGGLGVGHMLGCCKITKELIAALPNLWNDPVYWAECDTYLMRKALEVGQQPHMHRPAVLHMNRRELGQEVDEYYSKHYLSKLTGLPIKGN